MLRGKIKQVLLFFLFFSTFIFAIQAVSTPAYASCQRGIETTGFGGPGPYGYDYACVDGGSSDGQAQANFGYKSTHPGPTNATINNFFYVLIKCTGTTSADPGNCSAEAGGGTPIGSPIDISFSTDASGVGHFHWETSLPGLDSSSHWYQLDFCKKGAVCQDPQAGVQFFYQAPEAPDTQAPTCNYLNLSTGTVDEGANQTVTIGVSVKDDTAIQGVELFQGSTPIPNSANPLVVTGDGSKEVVFNYRYNTSALPAGRYKIITNANDTSGNVMEGLSSNCWKDLVVIKAPTPMPTQDPNANITIDWNNNCGTADHTSSTCAGNQAWLDMAFVNNYDQPVTVTYKVLKFWCSKSTGPNTTGQGCAEHPTEDYPPSITIPAKSGGTAGRQSIPHIAQAIGKEGSGTGTCGSAQIDVLWQRVDNTPEVNSSTGYWGYAYDSDEKDCVQIIPTPTTNPACASGTCSACALKKACPGSGIQTYDFCIDNTPDPNPGGTSLSYRQVNYIGNPPQYNPNFCKNATAFRCYASDAPTTCTSSYPLQPGDANYYNYSCTACQVPTPMVTATPTPQVVSQGCTIFPLTNGVYASWHVMIPKGDPAIPGDARFSDNKVHSTTSFNLVGCTDTTCGIRTPIEYYYGPNTTVTGSYFGGGTSCSYTFTIGAPPAATCNTLSSDTMQIVVNTVNDYAFDPLDPQWPAYIWETSSFDTCFQDPGQSYTPKTQQLQNFAQADPFQQVAGIKSSTITQLSKIFFAAKEKGENLLAKLTQTVMVLGTTTLRHSELVSESQEIPNQVRDDGLARGSNVSPKQQVLSAKTEPTLLAQAAPTPTPDSRCPDSFGQGFGQECGDSPNGGKIYCDENRQCSDTLCRNPYSGTSANYNGSPDCTFSDLPASSQSCLDTSQQTYCTKTGNPNNSITANGYGPGVYRCAYPNKPMMTVCGTSPNGGNMYCTDATPVSYPPTCSDTLCNRGSTGECGDGNVCTTDNCLANDSLGIGGRDTRGITAIAGHCPRTIMTEAVCETDTNGNPITLCSNTGTCSVPYVTCDNLNQNPSNTNNACCGTTNIQSRQCNGYCSQNGQMTPTTAQPGIVVHLEGECGIKLSQVTNQTGLAYFAVPVSKGRIRSGNFEKLRYKVWAEKPSGLTFTRGAIARPSKWGTVYTNPAETLGPGPDTLNNPTFTNVEGSLVSDGEGGNYVYGKILTFGFQGNAIAPVCTAMTANPTGGVLPINVQFNVSATNPSRMVAQWDSQQDVSSSQNISLFGITNSGNNVYALGKQTIYKTQVDGNGIPGKWNVAGQFPKDMYYSAVTIDNGYMFSVGGYASVPPYSLNKVYAGKINADGSVDSWQTLPDFPVIHYLSAAVVANDTLYVIGGQNNDTDIYAAKIAISGTTVNLVPLSGQTSVWTKVGERPNTTRAPAVTVWQDKLIVIGGNHTTAPPVDAFTINANGTLGTRQSLAPMTTQEAIGPVAQGTTVVRDNYIYYINPGYQAARAAPISIAGSNLSIGTWTLLSTPLSGLASVAVKDNNIIYGDLNRVNTGTINTTAHTLENWNRYLYNYPVNYEESFITVGNQLVSIGGRNTITLSNGYVWPFYAHGAVYTTKFTGENTLDLWKTSDEWKLPLSRYESYRKEPAYFATAAYNNNLYVLGGSEITYIPETWYPRITETKIKTIYKTQIDTNGNLIPWENIGDLPEAINYHSAVVYGSYLIVIGGTRAAIPQGTEAVKTIRYAKLNPDGTIDSSSWKQLADLPETLWLTTTLLHNGILYVMGPGINGEVMYSTSIITTQDAATPLVLDTWKTLTTPITRGNSIINPVINNGYLFIATTLNNLYVRFAARLLADGTLGAWTPIRALPEDNNNFSGQYTKVVSNNNNLFTFAPSTSGALENVTYKGTVNTADTGQFGSITQYGFDFKDKIIRGVNGVAELVKWPSATKDHVYNTFGLFSAEGYAKNDQGIWSNACIVPVNVTCPVMTVSQVTAGGQSQPITDSITIGPGDEIKLRVTGTTGPVQDTVWSTSNTPGYPITIKDGYAHVDPTYPPEEPQESSLFIAFTKRLWSGITNHTAFAAHTMGIKAQEITLVGRPLAAGQSTATGIIFVQDAGREGNICPTGYKTISVTIKPRTISGSVYIDKNKNNVKDTDEEAYTGGPITIRAIRNDRPLEVAAEFTSTINDGLYTLTNLGVLTGHTIQYMNPAGGYYAVSPPSFTHTSIKVGSECSIPLNSGAQCTTGSDLGNIINLNFGMTPLPWFQGKGGDMRIDTGFTDRIPAGALAGGVSAPYASLKNRTDGTGTPGIIFSGDQNYYFGQGFASENQFKWIAGGTSYKEIFKSANQGLIRTSYDYLMDIAKQNNITLKELDDPGGGGGSDICAGGKLDDCQLPGGLTSGVYHADGDLTMRENPSTYTFPANKNFVILVKGNLTLTKNMLVPYGSTVLFSVKGDIIVDKEVGVNENTPSLECTAPTRSGIDSTNCNLEGFFSTDKNFIIKGNTTFVSEDLGSECTTVKDKRLNIGGVVITNAGLTGGYLQNQRDLCEDDKKYPPVSIVERPDFIINAPTFLKRPNFVWQEVAP